MMEWSDEIVPVVEFLKSASVVDLTVWLRRRMEGADDIGGERDEAPHFIVASLFAALDHGICVNLEKAVIYLIEELADAPSSWSENGAAELLMLTDPVLLKSTRRIDLTALLSRLAETNGRVEVPVSTRVAAAHAMMTLDIKAAPEFWFTLYETSRKSEEQNPAYAAIVVEGLMRTDITALISWLNQNLPDPDLEHALINLIPFVVGRHGSEAAGQIFHSLQSMSRESQEELRTVFAMLRTGTRAGGIAPSVDLVTPLSRSLHLVSQLLREMIAVNVGDDVAQALAMNLESVRKTAVNQPNFVAASHFEELWDVYVDCIDHALSHEKLVPICVVELLHALPAKVIEKIALHLVEARGYPRDRLLELFAIHSFESPITLVEAVGGTRESLRFPVSLRDEVTNELRLRKDQKEARDRILRGVETAPSSETEWQAYFNAI